MWMVLSAWYEHQQLAASRSLSRDGQTASECPFLFSVKKPPAQKYKEHCFGANFIRLSNNKLIHKAKE